MLKNSSYIKAGGFSFLLHCAVIFLLILAGRPELVVAPENAAIEVEVEPARSALAPDMALNQEPAEPAGGSGELLSPSPEPEPVAAGPAPAAPSPPSPSPPAKTGQPAKIPAAAGAGKIDGQGTGDDEGEDAFGANCRYHPQPPYPQSARQAGREGVVHLQIKIDEYGIPTSVAVYQGSGDRTLDDAAIEGVKKWRYYPDRQSGRPAVSYRKVRVVFNLNDDQQ